MYPSVLTPQRAHPDGLKVESRVQVGLSPIRKLLLSTQFEDETLSDRQHRTIRNRETRFSPVGTSGHSERWLPVVPVKRDFR
jgi:hypothetical protein